MDSGAWQRTVLGGTRVRHGLASPPPPYWINSGIASAERQRDSASDIQVSSLPQTPLRSRMPHNIYQCSMCYAEGRSLLVMHFKYGSMYLSIPNSLAIPSTPHSPAPATMSSQCLSFRLSRCLVPAPPSSPPAYTHWRHKR